MPTHSSHYTDDFKHKNWQNPYGSPIFPPSFYHLHTYRPTSFTHLDPSPYILPNSAVTPKPLATLSCHFYLTHPSGYSLSILSNSHIDSPYNSHFLRHPPPMFSCCSDHPFMLPKQSGHLTRRPSCDFPPPLPETLCGPRHRLLPPYPYTFINSTST